MSSAQHPCLYGHRQSTSQSLLIQGGEHKNTPETADILWSHLAEKLTLKKLDGFFGNGKIGESTLFLFSSQLLLGKQ